MTVQRKIVQRRKRALAYFLTVPEKKVDLRTFYAGNYPHRISIIAEKGLLTPQCNAIACLAGWLWTMPEYIRWCRQQHVNHITSVQGLSDWLECSTRLFAPPQLIDNSLESHKSIAVRRLNDLINNAMYVKEMYDWSCD